VEAGASVTVISPQADFKILVLSSLARVRWEQRMYATGDCVGYDLLVIGSEDESPKLELVAEARKHSIPVNVCGEHGMSTFFFPAVLHEGDLTVAVSSGGVAPFMAVEFKRRLMSAVKGWGHWVRMAGRFRFAVLRNTKDRERQEEYYEKYVSAGPFQIDPEPTEKTSIAEWLQILRHANPATKPAKRQFEEPPLPETEHVEKGRMAHEPAK